ncbi:MAG: efflux RND transporter permease subunit [Sphingobacteriia bacterium]|nr:efflux RND transporter permease subunit [Sphingobacteriia bacterium]
MHSLIDYCLNHTKLIIFLFILIIFSGNSTYKQIPKESTPDITIPIIWVYVGYNGVVPDDSEKFLVKPLEKYLKTLENLKKIKSVAGRGYGYVELEFFAGFDSKKALNDVREKVNQAKSELPIGADEPQVNEINLSQFPVLNVILTGNIPEKTMKKIANDMKDKLMQLTDILKVELVGIREEIIDITIDPATLITYKIDINYLKQLVSSNLDLLLAGDIFQPTGKYSINLVSNVNKFADLNELGVHVKNNKVLKLNDLVSIKRTFEDKTSIARANNRPAYVLEISKRSGSNIIKTAQEVYKLVELEKENWPENLNVIYTQDKSKDILDMLKELENNIFLAIILALAPVLATMGLASSILVTLAIPGSFLMGILFLDFMNYSLNIVVLFSLILSVGMLVDAAIVVCEYAERKLIEGYTPKEAYALGAKRMVWPVLSSVGTTIVVFVPLLFWPGITGEFMKYLPITLIATLTSSLIMAFIFIPVIGAITRKKINASEEQIQQVMAAEEEGDLNNLNPFTKKYIELLNKVLDKPGKFCGSILGFLFVVYIFYFIFGTGFEFFPDVEPDNFGITIHSEGNYSIEQMDKVLKEVEKKITPLLGKDYKVQYSKIDTPKGMMASQYASDEIARITFELKDWRDRRKVKDITKDLLYLTKNIAGIKVNTIVERSGPNQGKPFELQLASSNKEALEKTFAQVKKEVNELGSLKNIEDNSQVKIIEWELKVNKNIANLYKVNSQTVSDIVQMLTQGINLAKIRLSDLNEEIDIKFRFPKENRVFYNLNYLMAPANGNYVPIIDVININPRYKISNIQRIEGYRTLYLKADLKDGYLLDTELNKLKERLKKLNISNDIQVKFSGDEEEKDETSDFLKIAFSVALFGILIIFLIEFDSFYYSFVIMSAVIFSTIGVLLGLIITNQPFGIVMCGVGIIALAGTVVNNNIIFIDTFLQMNPNISLRERLIRTGAQRIRPILLTATTAVLGLLPMVFKLSIDILGFDISFDSPSSQWWTQLSTSIAGGLTFATILTLFFTPALVLYGENIKTKLSLKKQNLKVKVIGLMS